MRNFRWQIKGVLAGANEPSGHRDTSFIVEKGIRVLVTLTEDPLAREDIAFLESQGVSYHHSPVLDGQAPTLRQLKWFVELVKESRAKEFPVLVHCRAGCGRAGTFISAYLIFTEGCSVKTAIRKVRRLFRSYYRLVCRGEPTQPQIAQLQEFAKQLKQGRATNHSARLKKQKLYQLVGGFALHNFSYLIPGVLAGSNLPYERSDLKWLFDKGIRVLVTAMDESLDEATVTSVGLTYYYYYVPPYGTPTLEQLQNFVELVDDSRSQNLPVCVHCYMGCGRTGTFLAAYLIHSETMDAEKAIRMTRHHRPCSIETHGQEKILAELVQHLHLRQS